ncbi:MAG: methylaspartate ammonia-lyase [Spirochaetes bacterium]|nr:methylaspartate ammonia-lyase [Spirochaetota bacterium]
MKIAKVAASAGLGGFFFDDQKAIKAGARADGAAYIGEPQTPGFSAVRQAGQSISVMFVLEDGQIAYGDCAAVQYSGAGGRDALFSAGDFLGIITREIAPLYTGLEITGFKEMARLADRHMDGGGRPLHSAIRYGVTQACLDAAAKAGKTLMAKVIAGEYGLELSQKRIPVFCQCGDDRYTNADKMILKGADVMPHGLFNSIEKTGKTGEKLTGYVKWLRERVLELRQSEGYNPVFHIDVYGTLGEAFGGGGDGGANNLEKIARFLSALEEVAKPFKLRIESPVDMGERQAQIDALAGLREILDGMGAGVHIVADEWCNTYDDIVAFADSKAGHMAQIKTPDLGGINNTIEAVLYCKERGMGAYLGGTCNETNRSAEVCAHIALATSPDQILAKPGMGVDEGLMIVQNEMNRVLALKDLA